MKSITAEMKSITADINLKRELPEETFPVLLEGLLPDRLEGREPYP